MTSPRPPRQISLAQSSSRSIAVVFLYQMALWAEAKKSLERRSIHHKIFSWLLLSVFIEARFVRDFLTHFLIIADPKTLPYLRVFPMISRRFLSIALAATFAAPSCFAATSGRDRTGTSNILTPPPPAKPRINGPRISAKRPGRPFLYTMPGRPSADELRRKWASRWIENRLRDRTHRGRRQNRRRIQRRAPGQERSRHR